jgi:TatD DNase family protein
MVLVDSHCHIEYKGDGPEARQWIERAQANSVAYFLNIGTDLESSRNAVELSGQYDCVYATVGLHPHDATQGTPENLEALKQLIGSKGVKGIGEVGLDYFYENSPRDVQIEALKKVLSWSSECSLPYVFHIRDAFSDFFEVFDQFPKNSIRGVVHCFTGTLEEAQGAIDRGLYISLTGILTFKKSQPLRDVVKEIPMDRLMVETDAPFLAPEGHRGKSNESSFLPVIAECLAEIKGISKEEVASITTANCKALFGFPAS